MSFDKPKMASCAALGAIGVAAETMEKSYRFICAVVEAKDEEVEGN